MLIFRTGHVHLIGQINKTGHLMKPCSEVVIYSIPERIGRERNLFQIEHKYEKVILPGVLHKLIQCNTYLDAGVPKEGSSKYKPS